MEKPVIGFINAANAWTIENIDTENPDRFTGLQGYGPFPRTDYPDIPIVDLRNDETGVGRYLSAAFTDIDETGRVTPERMISIARSINLKIIERGEPVL